MAGHTRLSPGIELYEIDRSQYLQKIDQSIVNTTGLICGFADKGEDYSVQWIDRMTTFENEYGFPKNEIERYFYNGVAEILDNGGVCIAAKLPYKNDSKDCFTAVEYQVENSNKDFENNVEILNILNEYDSSLLSCANIKFIGTSKITIDDFDKCKTGNSISYNGVSGKNKILIVDITRHKYGKVDLRINQAIKSNDSQIIGILPVVTGAANAIMFQNSIYKDYDYQSQFATDFNVVSNIQNRKFKNNNSLSSLYIENIYGSDPDKKCGNNFTVRICSEDYREQTLSKMAIDQFPNIKLIENGIFERINLKHIGVVVFKLVKDESNENRINFIPVESFVGSIDRNSKNEQTGASDYIGNIVNRNSQYINLFSNIENTKNLRNTSIYIVQNQPAAILGFYEEEYIKHIDYNESIMKPLQRILDRIQDSNQVPIDFIVDAGMSNIAQYVYQTKYQSEIANADYYPFINKDGVFTNWQMFNEIPNGWKILLGKFDDFCKNVRKDCMFIADGPRGFALDGNEKIVRPSNYNNTILQSIVPKIQYMQVLNSSYSAGYCNWFLANDRYSGDQFWMPPSIKMAGVYIYTDAYFHTWNAPAGFARGKIKNVLDISFNPLNDQAGRIYQQAWNYAVSYPIDGIIAEGQKTFQIQKTALDRVNVRRLMLYIEKNVIAVARRFLYEGNTAYLRQRFVDTIRPIFEYVKRGDGISDYAIRCDESLNDEHAIENHEMHCVIGIKPIKVIEWIKLSFIVTNQSANVSEEVMK